MSDRNRWTRFEKRSLVLGALLALGGAAGLFRSDADRVLADPAARRERPKPAIQQVAAVDAATQQTEEKMEAAMDEAFAHLDDFIGVLKKPAAVQKDFAIKYLAMAEGDLGEYLWVNQVKHEQQKFSGKIANQPAVAKQLKIEQVITVAEDDVVDWMYVENGILKGGYTIRAQRDMLAGDARKKFDEQFKFKFE